MAELSWDDLTEAADTRSAPIPEGEYLLAVDEVEYKLSRNGDPQLAFKLVVADEGAQKGRMVFHYATATSQSDAGKAMFVECVRAFLGAGARLPLGKGTPEENAAPFFGKTAKALLSHEEYQGNVNARVRRFIKDASSTPPPAAGADTPPPAAGADTPPPNPLG